MASGHYRLETKIIGRRVKGVDKSLSMVAKGVIPLCEPHLPPRLRVLPPWFAIAYAAPLELVIIVGRFLQRWRFHGAGAGPFVVQLRRY